MSVNKVLLIGRLGQDPELKYTPSGQGVCNFSVATSENWTDKSGQKQERTEWHRIVVWGRLAELANQYLAKGRQVYLEGKLQTRSWDDKDGNKRYTTEVQATNLQFLGGAQTQSNNQYGSPSRDNNQNNQNNSNSSSDNNGGFMDQSYNVQSDANFAADDIPF
jgi:single-strand DNA-binding protein